MPRIERTLGRWLDRQPLRRKLILAPALGTVLSLAGIGLVGSGIVSASTAALVAIGGGGLGFAGAVLVARQIGQTLCDVAQATVGLGDAAADTRIPEQRRPDEIGAVARALDGVRATLAELRRRAFSDPLTGLANRAAFEERLEAALAAQRRHRRGFALLLIDLDRFKEVNDGHGHAIGDRLLAEISVRFASVLRPGDTLARLGGDEFAVIQGDLGDGGPAQRLAERLIERASDPFHFDDQTMSVGASVGIAVCPNDGIDAEELLRHADLALYDAKEYSRQTWRFFTPTMHAAILERRSLELDLRAALESGDIDFVFQPQRELRTGRVVGLETLARWRHPERGSVPPVRFIALAESTGLIEPLGARALTTALHALNGWLGDTDACTDVEITVAVNLAVAQLRRPHFADDVEDALRAVDLPPRRLVLEVTEAVCTSDDATLIDTLQDLAAIGVRLALDDFGVGSTSVHHLRRLPLSEVKIDSSYVREAVKHAEAATVVRAVIGLAHAFQFRVTAEGIESEAQRQFVAMAGAERGQGYFLGEPVPAAAVPNLLRQRSWTPAV